MTISLADAKAHLNITDDADDALIQGKIDAACQWVSAFTGIPFDDEDVTIPAPVLEATRQLIAHLYENREASLVGIRAQELPFGFMDLLINYRQWAF